MLCSAGERDAWLDAALIFFSCCQSTHLLLVLCVSVCISVTFHKFGCWKLNLPKNSKYTSHRFSKWASAMIDFHNTPAPWSFASISLGLPLNNLLLLVHSKASAQFAISHDLHNQMFGFYLIWILKICMRFQAETHQCFFWSQSQVGNFLCSTFSEVLFTLQSAELSTKDYAEYLWFFFLHSLIRLSG